jgi:hypothetical protein
MRPPKNTHGMQNCASHVHGYSGTGGFGGRGCDSCAPAIESLRALLTCGVRFREDLGPGGEQRARERLSDCTAIRSPEEDGSRAPRLGVCIEEPPLCRLIYSMYSVFSFDGTMQFVPSGAQGHGVSCCHVAGAAGEDERSRFRFKGRRLSATCTSAAGSSIFPFSRLNL